MTCTKFGRFVVIQFLSLSLVRRTTKLVLSQALTLEGPPVVKLSLDQYYIGEVELFVEKTISVLRGSHIHCNHVKLVGLE